MLAIRLPADVEHRLEALAQATGRTKTEPVPVFRTVCYAAIGSDDSCFSGLT